MQPTMMRKSKIASLFFGVCWFCLCNNHICSNPCNVPASTTSRLHNAPMHALLQQVRLRGGATSMDDIDIKKLLMALKSVEDNKEGEGEDEDDDSGSVEIISSVEEDEPPPPKDEKARTKDNKAASDSKNQADSNIPEIPAPLPTRDTQAEFFARCSSSSRGRYASSRGARTEGPAPAGAEDDDEDLEIDGVRWKDFTKEDDEYETVEGRFD
jgi:hypothetical protein